MSKEVITVVVDEAGNIELSADGMRGKSCVEKTKWVEEALGLSDGKRKFKPEFHQNETVKQQQRT